MHVGVEASRLSREARGIGRYVRALLPELAAADPSVRFTCFAKDRDDVAALTAAIDTMHFLSGRCEVQPLDALGRVRTDLTWYPWNVVRPAAPPGPVVVTTHDIVPVALPDTRWHAFRTRWKWRRLYQGTVTRATRILADSAFTRDELVRTLGADPARVVVALLGGDDVHTQPADNRAAALAQWGISRPFVLCVGADEPRKNLGMARSAVATLRARGLAVQLVCVGPRKRALINADGVLELGFVSEQELAALYAEAAALVMPSTYEGFGLPLLEAMVAGTPAICARAASLPEVGGDAVMYVGAPDGRALVSAIERCATDVSWRADLSARGRARATQFTWAETARITLETFRDAVTTG
jgi:glycosyltransferase involved in cell wall biosynthesis